MKKKCCKCQAMAVWIYAPYTKDGLNHDYCDNCVERGYSCMVDYQTDEPLEDAQGRLLPCVEYDYYKDGKENMKMVKEHYHHIDNGGVFIKVIDKGALDGGLVLKIETQYHGHPAVSSELDIEHLGADWLQQVGLMFLSAAEEVRKIDFKKRYE